MNQRTDVATTRPENPVVLFKRDLEAVARGLDMLDDKARARMTNAAIVAVTKDPALLAADRASLIMAIRMCAQHGVTPDGNEATIQVYSTKVKEGGQERWIKKVQYMPMVRGIINRVLRSGKVQTFWAEVIYEGESFTLDTSHGDRRPVHAFDPLNRQGRIIGAYSVAKMTNGSVDTEVVNSADLARIRGVAKAQNVWDSWEGEKSKVAVMRRHSKRLPLSAEDMEFIINPEEHDLDQSVAVPRMTPLQRKAALARGEDVAEAEVVPEAEEAETVEEGDSVA